MSTWVNPIKCVNKQVKIHCHWVNNTGLANSMQMQNRLTPAQLLNIMHIELAEDHKQQVNSHTTRCCCRFYSVSPPSPQATCCPLWAWLSLQPNQISLGPGLRVLAHSRAALPDQYEMLWSCSLSGQGDKGHCPNNVYLTCKPVQVVMSL